KLIVEGEEEIDGSAIYPFIRAQRDLLACDLCLLESGNRDDHGRPAITLGVKGMLYVDLEVRSAAADSHSSYAPVVPNPAWELVAALNTLKDRAGRIL